VERPGPVAPRFRPFAAGAFGAWLAVTAIWWALAFAPLPVPADWLASARAVCFGTLPNGLPETWGWMLLALAPLSMLAFLVAVWGPELLESGHWLARRRAGAWLLVALGLGVSASAAAVSARVAAAESADAAVRALPAEDEALPDHYPRGADAAPALDLVDQHGDRVGLADLAGRPAIVTFAFAHCTTICPKLVATLKRARELAPAGAQPRLLVVTLDPWRDTPGSLPGLAHAWGLDELPEARVLSGAVDEVVAAHERWGVSSSRDETTGDITHPALIFVVDAEGRLAYQFLGPSPRWLAEALARISRVGPGPA
jgi:cytochrome oxidase Cu insertion factor (SCO1/SenC/PrrC family)